MAPALLKESIQRAVLSGKSCKETDREATRQILACRKRKKWRKALSIFELFRSKGANSNAAPGFFTYSAAISVCCRSERVMESLQLFHEMKCAARLDAALEPDIVVFRNIISCCAKQGRDSKVLYLFELMACDGIQPDDQTLAQIISVCVRNKLWDRATGILDEIHGRGGVLHMEDYENFIEECAVNGELGVAIEVFTMMQMAGVEPSSGVIHHVMQAIGRAKQPLLGIELMESCQECCIPVLVSTSACLLKMIHDTESSWLLSRFATVVQEYIGPEDMDISDEEEESWSHSGIVDLMVSAE